MLDLGVFVFVQRAGFTGLQQIRRVTVYKQCLFVYIGSYTSKNFQCILTDYSKNFFLCLAEESLPRVKHLLVNLNTNILFGW